MIIKQKAQFFSFSKSRAGYQSHTRQACFRIRVCCNLLKILQLVLCCCYSTPSEGWGYGRRPWSLRSWKLPRVWTRDRRDIESPKSEQRKASVASWTVKNEMRGFLGRVSAGTAGWILNSANPREIRAKQKAVSIAVKMRENKANMTREHKFLSGNQGTCVSKNFDETVCLQSEKRKEWIREVRG